MREPGSAAGIQASRWIQTLESGFRPPKKNERETGVEPATFSLGS
jgi:hypothetical protein